MHIWDVDYKAALVLEFLSEYLIDANVDYQARHGVHQFNAEFDHAKYKLDFPDNIMQGRNVDELAAVAIEILDHARARTLPAHVLVRHGVFQAILNQFTHLD